MFPGLESDSGSLISMSICSYMHVYACTYAIYACICMYDSCINTYKQIQTVIFVHMLCYIRAYFVYIFVIYSFIYAHIAHMCAYFLQPNPLVAQYEHIWARMHIYARIHTLYMHDTYNIQACFSCLLHVLCKSWYYMCMYMYVYVYMTFIRACIFGGSSYVPVCLYQYVHVCICMYMPVSETHVCI